MESIDRCGYARSELYPTVMMGPRGNDPLEKFYGVDRATLEEKLPSLNLHGKCRCGSRGSCRSRCGSRRGHGVGVGVGVGGATILKVIEIAVPLIPVALMSLQGVATIV